jgi:hypothetical protein
VAVKKTHSLTISRYHVGWIDGSFTCESYHITQYFG